MIKLVDMVYTGILMVQNFKAIGKMISKKDKDNNNGKINRNIKDNTKTEKSKVSENLFGVIIHDLKVNFSIMIYMVKVLIFGMMEESIKANGNKIK